LIQGAPATTSNYVELSLVGSANAGLAEVNKNIAAMRFVVLPSVVAIDRRTKSEAETPPPLLFTG
jgi:hypothetical protein